MSIQQALALPSPPPSNTVVINARCSLRKEADQRVIVVAGLPVHHYRAEDAAAEAYAMVFLVESGYAQQTDVARAFDRSVRTIRRYQERYADGGMAALSREDGWRRGRRRISGKRLRAIEVLKSQGMSNRAIVWALTRMPSASWSDLQSPPRAQSLRCLRSAPPRRSRRRPAHRRMRRAPMRRRKMAPRAAIWSQRLKLRTTMSRCR
jgi:Winged helix-turn helix